MNYAIINNIAQFMPVHENDKIKALCDIYNVPYEAVEEIGINDEVLLSVSVKMLTSHAEYFETFRSFVASQHIYNQHESRRLRRRDKVQN